MERGRSGRVVGQRRLDPELLEPSEAAPAPDPIEPAPPPLARPAPIRPPIDRSVPSGLALRERQMAWLKERARFEEKAARSEPPAEPPS